MYVYIYTYVCVYIYMDMASCDDDIGIENVAFHHVIQTSHD